mgnify:CR=1 FL=1|jgi:S-layer homology domain.
MKSFFSILLTCLLLTGTFISTAAAESSKNDSLLIDIKGHWAEAAIKTAVEKGYVSGYTDGAFKPNAEVTRAEFLKMLVAAMKLETTEANGSWYQPYVDAATKAGYYANDFASATWDKSIPRKEMATLAVRAGITGYRQDYDANRNLYEAAKAGIIQGVGKGEIAPDGVTTRASAVVVIERILDIKAGKKLDSDKYATGAAEVLWHRTNVVTTLPKYFGKPTSNEDYIDDSRLVSKSKDGVAVCSVRQYVVVDLDDANDPNRKLLSQYKLGWYDAVGTTFELNATKNAYAIIGVYDTKINGKLRPNSGRNYISCSISVGNVYLDSVAARNTSNSPANPDGVYFISEFKPNSDHKDYQSLVNFPDIKKYVSGQVTSGTITSIEGLLIDKDYLNKVPKGQTINLSLAPITHDNVTGFYTTVVQ